MSPHDFPPVSGDFFNIIISIERSVFLFFIDKSILSVIIQELKNTI